MAPNSRVAKACEAMKNIGIREETVKPVLKNLLDLYGKNWKLIEDENYRVLVDAIFDHEDSKKEESKNQEYSLQDLEEPAPRKKKSLLRSQSDHASASRGDCCPSSKVSPLKQELECAQVSQTSCKQKVVKSTHICLGDKRKQPRIVNPHENCPGNGKKTSATQSCLVPIQTKPSKLLASNSLAQSDILLPWKHLDNNKEAPVSRQIVQRDKRLNYEKGSHVNCKKSKVMLDDDLLQVENLLDEYHSDCTKPKTQLLSGDLPQFEVPLAIMSPDEDDSPIRNCSKFEGNDLRILESKHLQTENKDDADSSQFDIASSPNGDVKISLIFNIQQSHNCIPSVDAVLKLMEKRCLISYRITESGFSLIKLMKDICECFLEQGTGSGDDEQARYVSNKSSALVALDGRGDGRGNFCIPSSSRNGSFRYQNLVEGLPEFTRPIASNNLETLHGITDLKINGKNYGGREQKTNVLKGLKSTYSSSMVAVQKHHLSRDPLKHLHYIDDITKGEENVKISLINDITNDSLPNFNYIPRNMTYQNAYVKFLLARISDENCCSNCFGDCVLSAIPCACAGETGGEFAYTSRGLLENKFLEKCISMNSDPQQHNLFYCENCPLERSKDRALSGSCKGHLVRKFIKECWYKCGCSKNCGNRVVQRGITVNIQVFMTSEGKGWGLRTLEDLPRGAFVCEYVGEIVTNMELYERNMQNSSDHKHTYPVLLDADWGSEGVLKDEEALCLDATFYGNVARFINHRCIDANLVEIPVEVETPDHHYYHLAFFTRRKVDAFEELTWDYGIDFNDRSHPVKAFKCQCGSKFCRDVKRPKRDRSSS